MKHTFPFLLMACAAAACAQAGESQLETVRKNVSTKVPGINAEMITPSAAPGLYQVKRGQDFAYVTNDGRYLIIGDMIDLVTGEEITEAQRSKARQAVIGQFGPDEVIEFLPKNPKYIITVFTDLDCGYCRKLHAEMAKYNAQGIGVRYLFFPRGGPKTPSFEQAQAVWCSGNRRDALTNAKRGAHITAPTTCPNPVQKHYDAGDALGIVATPTLIFPDGELVRGYIPAPVLAARLASDGKTARN